MSANLPRMLPQAAFTRAGVQFYPTDEIWSFQDAVTPGHFDFLALRDTVMPEPMQGLKSALAWLLQNRAVATALNAYSSFKHFLLLTGRSKERPIREITQFDLISYRSMLTKQQGNRFLMLAVLLKKWHGLGLRGVSDDAIGFLKCLRMKKPDAGVPVLTMCSKQGPLTQLEDEAYQDGLNAAFARGELSEMAFFACWVTRAIGQRPCQTAALKVCDLVVEARPDGSDEYLLKVPRAKRRDAIHPRSSLKVRPLIQQLGAPLHAYVQRVRASFDGRLRDPSQAPMFPSQRGALVDGPFSGHMTARQIGAVIQSAGRKIKAQSERTGRPLNVTPARLRRTVGTRAAEEGHGELLVGEILDHTNVASARYYVEAVPSIVIRIDAAMANHLAPLARAFQGEPPEQAAPDRGDSSSLIIDLRVDQSGKPMGQCAGTGSCRFSAPLSCYTCRSFKPWLDGPHQKVLDDLIARRDQQLSRNGSRMASINDRTLLAVAEVIQICAAAKKGGSNG
jgi:integrase